MKTQKLGQSDLVSTRLSFGNMRCLNTWNPKDVDDAHMQVGIAAHIAAFGAGYTLFDWADIYCHMVCETGLGKTLSRVNGMREKVIIAVGPPLARRFEVGR